MSAMDTQQVFKSTFDALVNEDCSISVDIDRYQSALDHALSKMDFSIGTSIYMLPNNLNSDIEKTAEYNEKILISNIDMKIGSKGTIKKR